MVTNLEAAAEVIAGNWGDDWSDWQSLTWAALDAIDPRLIDLTPEDTKAILDWTTATIVDKDIGAAFMAIPDHVWEVLGVS